MNILETTFHKKDRTVLKPQYDVLVIEDEPQIRNALKEAIEMDGHTVVTAANGREAFKILKKMSPPRLILLDLFMPVMSGYEFLDLKPEVPEIAEIPVVIVSAAGNDMKGPGIAGFLRKPVDLDKLYSVVDQYVH